MQIKCNDELKLIRGNDPPATVILKGIGYRNGIVTYDCIRKIPEILTEPIYHFEIDYQDTLSLINALITARNTEELIQSSSYIKGNPLLTCSQKEYTLMKIENAYCNYYKALEMGHTYVWNLPQNQRTYKAYLWTERYIKYSLKHGDRQLCTAIRLYKFLYHDTGIGKIML